MPSRWAKYNLILTTYCNSMHCCRMRIEVDHVVVKIAQCRNVRNCRAVETVAITRTVEKQFNIPFL